MSEYVAQIQKVLKGQPFGSRPVKLLSKLCSDAMAARERSSAEVMLAAGSTDSLIVFTRRFVHAAALLRGKAYVLSYSSSALTSAHARGAQVLVLGAECLYFGPAALGNVSRVREVVSYVNDFHQRTTETDRTAPLGVIPITSTKAAYGVRTTPQGLANLVAYQDRLEIEAGQGVEPVRVPYASVDELSISGRGVVRTGGGFVGGGQIGNGAGVGLLAAAALNAATSKAHIECKIDLKFDGGHLSGVTDALLPEECEANLAPALATLRRQAGTAGHSGLGAELDRIARLRADGHLTDLEFAIAKSRILGS